MKIRHILAGALFSIATFTSPALAGSTKFPDAKQVWQISDYQQFSTAMTNAKPKKWPKWKSGAADTEIARFRALDPLPVCSDQSVEIADRFLGCIDFFEAATQVFKSYSLNLLSTGKFEAESMVTMGALLKIIAPMSATGEAFLATFDVDDPTYVIRVEGRDMMRHGQTQMLEGALITLQSNQSSDPKALRVLAEDVAETFEDILVYLPEDTRVRLRAQVQRVVTIQKDEEIKSLLTPFLPVEG